MDALRNILVFENTVSEAFITEDGSILDAGCSRSYRDAAAIKTSDMRLIIEEEMKGTTQCEGVGEIVASTQSFVALGDQVT